MLTVKICYRCLCSFKKDVVTADQIHVLRLIILKLSDAICYTIIENFIKLALHYFHFYAIIISMNYPHLDKLFIINY